MIYVPRAKKPNTVFMTLLIIGKEVKNIPMVFTDLVLLIILRLALLHLLV